MSTPEGTRIGIMLYLAEHLLKEKIHRGVEHEPMLLTAFKIAATGDRARFEKYVSLHCPAGAREMVLSLADETIFTELERRELCTTGSADLRPRWEEWHVATRSVLEMLLGPPEGVPQRGVPRIWGEPGGSPWTAST